MQRPVSRSAWLIAGLLLTGAAGAADVLNPAQSATVLGPPNPMLTEGSRQLEAGHYQEGVRLTLAGLDQPNSVKDQAAGHSNLCAGYVALKQLEEALTHCNRALQLDGTNWRTYNNRAAVFVGMGKYDLALTDLNAGLELAPDSEILHKSRQVVLQHHNGAGRDNWRRPDKI